MQKKLKNFQEALQQKSYQFISKDFRKTDDFDENTFIYCDPPYRITTASYNENGGWGLQDDLDLFDYLDKANESGAKFALSNVVLHKNRENLELIKWSTNNNLHLLNYNYNNSNYHSQAKKSDTSFRRKTLLDDYKTLLPILEQHNRQLPVWDNNSQTIFYQTVLRDTELFDRSESDEPAKRARTLTNALIKSGLIDNKRKLSEVAHHWINNEIKNFDELEQAIGISKDNLVFFRQFLKLRVYDKHENFFYPLRVALKFLTTYSNVPEQDFLVLLHSIPSDYKDSQINEIIFSYGKVARNEQTFGEFISENFSDGLIDNFNVKKLFSTELLDAELFNSLFVNRKSSGVQKDYFDSVNSLFIILV